MSGENRGRLATGETVRDTVDERLTPLVGGKTPDRTSTPTRSATVPTSVLTAIGQAVVDGEIAVDDGLITESLDEILLALIASSNTDTHGTGLMERLERQFDARLSPGTVYPRLHELEADGLLEMHELVQTKQYSIADRSSAAAGIERAARQHLALGVFLQASLDAMDAVPSDD